MSHITSPSPHSSAALCALDARRSVPPKQLGEPGPDDATVLRMLRSAVRVPDHGKRVPFRFISFSGDARDAFGQRLAERSLALNPNASEATIDKDRGRFSHAPLVVAVIAKLGPDESIPESERFSSACCACFALLQAAQALDFAGIWLTGWPAYDPQVRGWLGLDEFERVVGFVHIGTPKRELPERERPDPSDLLSAWTPA